MLLRLPKRPILLLLLAALVIVFCLTLIQAQGTAAFSPSRGAAHRMAGRMITSPPPVDFQPAVNYNCLSAEALKFVLYCGVKLVEVKEE